MSRKNNENTNWGINLVTATEEEVREKIEELRNDLVTEDVIKHFLNDVRKAKESMHNLNEEKINEIDEEFSDPLDIDRRPLQDGIYEVKNCSFQIIKRKTEYNSIERRIKANLFIYDYETDRKVEVNVIYNEQFFQNLYTNLSTWFNDFKPKTLKDCLKLCKENKWYIQKMTKGIYTNYYPCRYSPVIDISYYNDVYEIEEI